MLGWVPYDIHKQETGMNWSQWSYTCAIRIRHHLSKLPHSNTPEHRGLMLRTKSELCYGVGYSDSEIQKVLAANLDAGIWRMSISAEHSVASVLSSVRVFCGSNTLSIFRDCSCTTGVLPLVMMAAWLRLQLIINCRSGTGCWGKSSWSADLTVIISCVCCEFRLCKVTYGICFMCIPKAVKPTVSPSLLREAYYCNFLPGLEASHFTPYVWKAAGKHLFLFHHSDQVSSLRSLTGTSSPCHLHQLQAALPPHTQGFMPYCLTAVACISTLIYTAGPFSCVYAPV